jgi:hypothetical protein
MEYMYEDSERQLARDFVIWVSFILQMHADNYVSDVCELRAFSHMVFGDGNVKELLEHTRWEQPTNEQTHQPTNQPTN